MYPEDNSQSTGAQDSLRCSRTTLQHVYTIPFTTEILLPPSLRLPAANMLMSSLPG